MLTTGLAQNIDHHISLQVLECEIVVTESHFSAMIKVALIATS